MSRTNRETARRLGVHYLFGRWGITFYTTLPDDKKTWRIRLVPLDGWIFEPHSIIEECANDPDSSISYQSTTQERKEES